MSKKEPSVAELKAKAMMKFHERQEKRYQARHAERMAVIGRGDEPLPRRPLPSPKPRRTTKAGKDAMEAFGFGLEEYRHPTAERIADHLAECIAKVESNKTAGLAALRELLLALDAWQACMSRRA